MAQNKYYGETGLDSLEVGGNNPIFSFLTSAMASGKALADDGKAYDSVQNAENAASSFVLVGPGTFNESVTIDTAGLTLMGAGYDTLIDGGTAGTAIGVTASDVTVRDLSVSTTPGSGNVYRGLNLSSGGTAINVTVRDSDNDGISLGTDGIAANCTVEICDGQGISVSLRGIVVSSIVQDSRSHGIHANTDDAIITNNVVYGTSATGDGILVDTDCVIVGNRVHWDGDNGIKVNNNDNIAANNRISGSTANIFDSGTGTVLDDNLTGAAN